MNGEKVFDAPVPIADSVNKRAEKISNFFLPNLSLKIPEVIAPNKQPINAQLIAQPCKLDEPVISKNFS